MTGVRSGWLRFAGVHIRHGCRKQDPQLPAPEAVTSVPLLVILMMLLCAGDIETNPGPRDDPHPKLKSLHALLEKAVRLLEQVFGGSTKEDYLSTAMILAGTEVTETMMYLNAEFRELGFEEGEKKLQAEFLARVSNSVEVLHLFYKIPRAFFLGKSCNMCSQHFFSRLYFFLKNSWKRGGVSFVLARLLPLHSGHHWGLGGQQCLSLSSASFVGLALRQHQLHQESWLQWHVRE